MSYENFCLQQKVFQNRVFNNRVFTVIRIIHASILLKDKIHNDKVWCPYGPLKKAVVFHVLISYEGTFLILLQISSHICDMNILLGFHAVSFFPCDQITQFHVAYCTKST